MLGVRPTSGPHGDRPGHARIGGVRGNFPARASPTSVRAMMRARLALVSFCSVLSLAACDEKKDAPAKAESAAEAPKAEAPKVDEVKKAPPRLVLYVDPSGVSVGGTLVDAKREDLEAGIAEALAKGPFTMPDPFEVSVARQALVPTVRALVAALKKHGERQVVLKTATRKGDLAALPVTIETSSLKGASAAGVGKDGSIAVWPAVGGGARKKSRGFAGPDLTLGGELVGKAVGEGGALVYNGDDMVQWGLVFDLAQTRVEYKNASTAAVAIAGGRYEPGKKVAF